MPASGNLIYTDLLIRILGLHGEQTYTAEAWIDGELAVSEAVIQLDIPLLRRQDNDPEAYGLTLFYGLLSGELRAAYDKARGLAQAAGTAGLRLRLWIDDQAAALQTLTWERLHTFHAGEPAPLAVLADMPFSRYVESDAPPPALIRSPTVRMLLAVANPSDLDHDRFAPIDVTGEIRGMLESVSTLRRGRRLRVDVMPGQSGLDPALVDEFPDVGWDVLAGPTSMDAILRALSSGDGYHMLHLLAHGYVRRRDQAATLFLEDQQGQIHQIDASSFTERLRATDHLPMLTVLAACQSGRAGEEGAGGGLARIGLAPRLVAAGAPAVVAMQDDVPMNTVHELTGDFYRYLLEHGVVDRALSQARLLLYREQSDAWAIPVLMTRMRDGQLFAADPIRSMLRQMSETKALNPLRHEDDYIPLEVVHFSGSLTSMDALRVDARNPKPVRDALVAVDDLLGRSVVVETDARLTTSGASRVIALVGETGMGKSFLLRRIGKITALDALDPEAARSIVPVLLDFTVYADQLDTAAGLDHYILETLTHFWPDLDREQLHDLMTADHGPIFRLLLDGTDRLSRRTRRHIWRSLDTFVRSYPRHQAIVACGMDFDDLAALRPTDYLVIQPVSRHMIRWYLAGHGDVGNQLAMALQAADLYDLAAYPWVLVKLLEQARRGSCPTRRLEVVEGLLEDDVTAIAVDQTMRHRIIASLHALAWRMIDTLRLSLPLDEAFQVLADVRGSRGYDLETLYADLVREEILVPGGDDEVRFSRAAIQAYCAAQALSAHPDQARLLDDIAATLGRRTRLYWWEDSLLLHASQMDAPEDVVRAVLYGVASGSGDQIMLAARIIQECGPASFEEPFLDYVVRTLVYQLDDRRESRVWRRIKLAETLGRIRHTSAVAHLARVANRRIRTVGCEGGAEFEYSSVRLAALMALYHLVTPSFDEVAALDPELAQVLRAWEAEDVMTLTDFLVEPGPSEQGDRQALAAFALGDLQTAPAFDILVQLFLYPGASNQTYRNLTTALTLMDAGMVTRRVILPLLSEALCRAQHLPDEICEDRRSWYPHVIYLAGQIHASDERVLQFLRARMRKDEDAYVRGLAIQSLGWLYDLASKRTIEDIAAGAFEAISLPASISDSQQRYLQQQALEALYYLGDAQTLERFRRRPDSWTTEMETAFYEASEEIIWRERGLSVR
jgi:hypothetical protein